MKKLSKHKAFIRKLGSSKKISGQVLGKNYSIVIEIIRIGIQHNEISSKVCPSTKRRMGKSKSSLEKSKTIGYCKRKEESTSTESGEEQFSEGSEEHVSSEELSSEEEEFSSEGNYTEKSECSSSGEEFTEEYSETEESFKEKNPNRINQKKKKVYRSLKSFIPTIKKEEKEYVKLLILFINKNKDNIKWNSKGEFYYKNQKVLNSNIGKLINHSISNMKSQPVGMTKFNKMLAVLGVPEYLILNEKGKAILDKYLKQRNYTWRPPGNLNAEY